MAISLGIYPIFRQTHFSQSHFCRIKPSHGRLARLAAPHAAASAADFARPAPRRYRPPG